jgi:DnaJ like chaperone protein
LSKITFKNIKNRNKIIKWRSDLIIKKDINYRGYYEFIVISSIVLIISKSLKLNKGFYNLDVKNNIIRFFPFTFKKNNINSIDKLFFEAQKDSRTLESCIEYLKSTILNSNEIKTSILNGFLEFFTFSNEINKNDIIILKKIFIGFEYDERQFITFLRSQILIENKNPFILLNVSKNTSKSDLNITYKKIVKKYHPDRLHGYEDIPELLELLSEQFIIYNKAYNIITKKRKFRN